MKRTPIDARPDQLRHADWNPRRNITPESVADLTASIRELGLVQRVTVIEDPDGARLPDGRGRYVVVAGNRRRSSSPSWTPRGARSRASRARGSGTGNRFQVLGVGFQQGQRKDEGCEDGRE